MRLKILSINVRGLGSAQKSANIVNNLCHQQCESGVWHLNNSLLSNTDFKNVIKGVIADFKLKIPAFASLREWRDSPKTEIRKS